MLSRLRGPGLASLRELQQLQTLQLTGSTFGDSVLDDSALPHLARLVYLTDLRLRKTQVSDTGLKGLMDLPAIELLGVSDTRVSKAGIALFKARHPQCNVF